MSPSRGFNLFFRRGLKIDISRPSTRHFSQFVQTAKNPSNKTQIYLSRNLDPILNLSIEHYLLQKTPEDSTVLFLYTNKPCVVIGRNQNPWVEVNFSAIQSSKEPIRLVRRRSGGGTVFHDLGNVNYSVICPTAAFDRDKHAEMVVRALHKLGVDTTRVNKRHDIVLDRTEATGEKKALKVSGSAYKLTRLRSLHHGTCLLNSPNLGEIGKYLRPVAKHSIEARGVESVSSPVTNVNVPNAEFEQAVISEFLEMYGASDPITVSSSEDAMRVPEIEKGYDELKSADWIYGQTPQFTFSNPQIDPKVSVTFTARNGIVKTADIRLGQSEEEDRLANEKLVGRKLHEVEDWQDILGVSTSMKQYFPTHYLRHTEQIPALQGADCTEAEK